MPPPCGEELRTSNDSEVRGVPWLPSNDGLQIQNNLHSRRSPDRELCESDEQARH